MSKYNIEISEHLWYLVKENKTYYFLEGDCHHRFSKITDEQVLYIKEMYDNTIGNSIFLHKRIISPRYFIEKEGFALCVDGFTSDISNFSITKLSVILQEPIQRKRDFETVIFIKDNNRRNHSYGAFNADYGRIFYDIEIMVMRRALNEKLTKSYKKNHYDYYDIPITFDPDNPNCINYMPTEKDIRSQETDNYETIVIPFTKERYLKLQKIAEGFNKLGFAFREFLVFGMEKSLPYFQDKEAIDVGKSTGN
jgi:hypothetical protein